MPAHIVSLITYFAVLNCICVDICIYSNCCKKNCIFSPQQLLCLLDPPYTAVLCLVLVFLSLRLQCNDNAVVQEDSDEGEGMFRDLRASIDSGASVLTAIGKVSVNWFVICRFLIFCSFEKLFALFDHPLSATRPGLLR